MNRKYLIDSNVFITAQRQIYPFDIAPGFWAQFLEKAAEDIIIIESVDDEIVKGNDKLKEWYLENKEQFEVATIPDQAVLKSYGDIINFINESNQYSQSAKDEFASLADSWLCAYGLAFDYTIVTLEKLQINARRRVLIPNVCEEFDIKYIDLLQLMRDVGIRLI